MTVVIDASVAFAALTQGGDRSLWARQVLSSADVVGPELLVVEVAHLARKSVISGQLPPGEAGIILSDLTEAVDVLLPHRPLLGRIWELHPNVTSYDATYVALAEALEAPLATLDHRLARASGPRCEFITPAR